MNDIFDFYRVTQQHMNSVLCSSPVSKGERERVEARATLCCYFGCVSLAQMRIMRMRYDRGALTIHQDQVTKYDTSGLMTEIV